jgi:hypothetical protein
MGGPVQDAVAPGWPSLVCPVPLLCVFRVLWRLIGQVHLVVYFRSGGCCDSVFVGWREYDWGFIEPLKRAARATLSGELVMLEEVKVV